MPRHEAEKSESKRHALKTGTKILSDLTTTRTTHKLNITGPWLTRFVFQVLNQHIAQFSGGHVAPAAAFNGQYPSHYSSRETGYNSGNEGSQRIPRFNRFNEPESTIVQREEVETEIF